MIRHERSFSPDRGDAPAVEGSGRQVHGEHEAGPGTPPALTILQYQGAAVPLGNLPGEHEPDP